MCGRVFRGFTSVVCRGQDLLSAGNDSAYGDLSLLRSLRSLFERQSHHHEVSSGFGISGFKFSAHTDDDIKRHTRSILEDARIFVALEGSCVVEPGAR